MKHSLLRSLTIFIQISFVAIVLALFGCDQAPIEPPGPTDERNGIAPEAGNDGYAYSKDGTGGGDYYPGTEKFGELYFNQFTFTADDQLSTFGVDVDNGSYTFGRKKINEGRLPPKESVRIEEYINYFRQDYDPPANEPFSIQVDGAPSLFRGDSLHILRIGIQGRELSDEERMPWNLTFLLDISGSMTSRLDLVKQSLYILVDNMQTGDKISICTYAGSVGTVLTPTTLSDNDKEGIKGIISDLVAGGSTAMASGIQNAYDVNTLGLIAEGVNRVIVCSDGDANVGATSHQEILDLIAAYVENGITLSTLGYGQGNYNDQLMEQLADRGNGNYYYIDTLSEAERLFTEELIAMMEVVAKDVKVQVEFDPQSIIRYRLLGYENRNIDDEDFEDETVDAGEIGAGHRVTALYEIELTEGASGHLLTVHLRYKRPNGTTDIPVDAVVTVGDLEETFAAASDRFQFTVAVAEFAEILRESPYVSTSLEDVENLTQQVLAWDDDRDVDFLDLIRKAISID